MAVGDLQVDEGHRVLRDLIEAFGNLSLEDANEAETRFKVIDGVLEKVLGWQKDDINVEEACEEFGHTDYADYIVRTATTSFVVEAKRVGSSFRLPTNHKSGKLGGVLSSGPIGEAIQQARKYCQLKAAQFAVVTNGNAWIVFPAVRVDGVTFEETQARVFRSLDDLHKRFVEFWELLSRQRVIEGNLEAELLRREFDIPVRRALTLLRDPNLRLPRNTLYPHLSTAVAKALTDEGLLGDADALRFCYVRNTERTAFDARLKMHLADPKPQLGIAATRVRTSKKTHDYFDQRIEASSTAQPKFFLILGQVGAGKTTFLAYTRSVSSKESIQGAIVWLYIDFKKATKEDVPRTFIYERLLELLEADKEFDLGDWEKTINPAYAQEVANLARGPLFLLKKSDPTAFERAVSDVVMNDRSKIIPYVDKVLGYVAALRPVFIAIDNVDQIEDDERQNEIFAEAAALAQRHKVSIIISLRDTTYRKYRSKPTFDAFETDAIYIDAPSVVPVLARRFQFARKLLSGAKAELTLASGIRFRADDVGAFFEIAAQSLLSVDGAELLDTLAGGNIRRGLTLAREFLASGHVTADVALQTYLTNRAWRFPVHEVFKGAVLGGRKFYREEDSLLPNMYCAKLGIPSLQLMRLHIADSLVNQASSSNFEGMPIDELSAALHQVGVAHREVELVVRNLLDSSIIRTADGAPLGSESRLIPTRLAGYLVQDLMGRFNYAEMCTLDAHIYDDELWDKIRSLTQQVESQPSPLQRLHLRFARVRQFIAHLESIEERWVVEAKRRSLGAEWTESPVRQRLKVLLEEDFNRAEASARHRVDRKGA
jgi:hypothetical protein